MESKKRARIMSTTPYNSAEALFKELSLLTTNCKCSSLTYSAEKDNNYTAQDYIINSEHQVRISSCGNTWRAAHWFYIEGNIVKLWGKGKEYRSLQIFREMCSRVSDSWQSIIFGFPPEEESIDLKPWQTVMNSLAFMFLHKMTWRKSGHV